jgi:radical SAM protein with 4Fe4S-binding SPASM domain
METLANHTAQAGAFECTDSRHVSRLISPKADPNAIIAAQVGPGYWDYRRRWDLARTFQERPDFPIQVDYELFYRCNLRCPICLMSLPAEEKARWGDPSVSLDIGVIKKLLDEGAAQGQVAVGLNGICEPLLSPDLVEIIRYAKSLGMLDIMFNTNGLLLDETISRALVTSGLTRLMISIDAVNQDTYAQIRVGSDLNIVTKNVKRFIRLRNRMGLTLPIVRVSFCVTRMNEHELDDFMAAWSEVADFFSIQHYGNTFDGEYALDRSRLFPKHHRYDPGPAPRCGQPWKRVMIRHNGDVIPCCDASGLDLVIGNIHQHSLSEIWRGPQAESIRRLHQEGRYQEHPVCRACMTKWGPRPDPSPFTPR